MPIDKAGHYFKSYKWLTDSYILSYVYLLTVTALNKASYVYISDIHSAFLSLWEG